MGGKKKSRRTKQSESSVFVHGVRRAKNAQHYSGNIATDRAVRKRDSMADRPMFDMPASDFGAPIELLGGMGTLHRKHHEDALGEIEHHMYVGSALGTPEPSRRKVEKTVRKDYMEEANYFFPKESEIKAREQYKRSIGPQIYDPNQYPTGGVGPHLVNPEQYSQPAGPHHAKGEQYPIAIGPVYFNPEQYDHPIGPQYVDTNQYSEPAGPSQARIQYDEPIGPTRSLGERLGQKAHETKETIVSARDELYGYERTKSGKIKDSGVGRINFFEGNPFAGMDPMGVGGHPAARSFGRPGSPYRSGGRRSRRSRHDED